MLPASLKSIFSRFFGFQHLTPEEIEHRTLALTIIVLITLLDFTYNLAFYLFDGTFTWWTTATYFVASTVNLIRFKSKGNFRSFRNFQIVLTIALPLLAQITHGGFSNGSGVVLAAFLAPLGTMMFASLRTARITFFAYLAALAFAGVWEYFARPAPNNLPRELHLLFFEFNFSFTAAVAYFLMEGFLRNKASLLAMVQAEHEKADSLLLDILPAETAQELKENGSVQAKSYQVATVMFTDFVGFSAFARTLTAEALVEQIDFYFRAFDDIVNKHDLEKIKTIGDSYMCAGGLPVHTQDHVRHILKAAIEIRQFVKTHRQKKLEQFGYPFDLRIGIHTGPVVAGVVGSSKIAYDIWGETVNIASRMEQNCDPLRINISEATHAHIKDHFQCSYRGRFEAKHVGEIDMYYVDE
ncbi:MAG: adenylate/guanylate cyclase domain-containing protein [Saprospiraceae bacterium]|nr:adenylate/guanylate cyclase domain-containing protein [Saprospiraceae bacterium]